MVSSSLFLPVVQSSLAGAERETLGILAAKRTVTDNMTGLLLFLHEKNSDHYKFLSCQLFDLIFYPGALALVFADLRLNIIIEVYGKDCMLVLSCII